MIWWVFVEFVEDLLEESLVVFIESDFVGHERNKSKNPCVCKDIWVFDKIN